MELLKVPLIKQNDDSLCGPTSLDMVLKYYKVTTGGQEILALYCKHTYELGCDDYGMKQAVEALGLKVIINQNCTYSNIEFYLDKGMPVIVDYFSGGCPASKLESEDSLPNGHNSVIVGLDEDFIYMNDPECGELHQYRKEYFSRVWFDFRPPIIKDFTDMIIRQIFVIIKPEEKK